MSVQSDSAVLDSVTKSAVMKTLMTPSISRRAAAAGLSTGCPDT